MEECTLASFPPFHPKQAGRFACVSPIPPHADSRHVVVAPRRALRARIFLFPSILLPLDLRDLRVLLLDLPFVRWPEILAQKITARRSRNHNEASSARFGVSAF